MGFPDVGRSGASLIWQMQRVVDSSFVKEDAKLDLVSDYGSDQTVSHHGKWSWLPSSSDTHRSREIRAAFAEALDNMTGRDVQGSTGSKELDAIIDRLRGNTKPLTKREVRQTLDDVAKFLPKKPEPEKQPPKAEVKEKPQPKAEVNSSMLKDELPIKENPDEPFDNFAIRRDNKVLELVRKHMPNLENRIRELRAKTIELLGLGKDLEGWLDSEMPEFNLDSQRFKDIARETIVGKQVRTLEQLENEIFNACRMKDTLQFVQLDEKGEEQGVRLVAIYLDEIVPDDGAKSLTADDYNSCVTKYADENKLRLKQQYSVPILTMLSRAGKMNEVNELFKEFVRKPDLNLEEIVGQALISAGSKDKLKPKDIAEIRDTLDRSVLQQLRKAENIWDVQPLSFSRCLIDKIVLQGKVDVKACVSDIIKTLVQDFVPKEDQPDSGRIRLAFEKRIPCQKDKSMNAKDVIESAIKENTGLTQVGGNNCFMISLVNGLLGIEGGRKILKNCFCEQKNSYTFRDPFGTKFTLSQKQVDGILKPYPAAKDMSPLERGIWAAYLHCASEHPDLNLNAGRPGQQCASTDFAFLFGLEQAPANRASENVGVKLPESLLNTLVAAHNHLAAGHVAIVHTGSPQAGHYRAITGVIPGTIDSGKLNCFESLEDQGAEISLQSKSLESVTQGDGAQIFMLALPKDID